ncbi:MAG: helicase-related protein [Gammaproteobacteria bacterium]|nr:helicase-related protein [Gammaproteobacteria bacterium]
MTLAPPLSLVVGAWVVHRSTEKLGRVVAQGDGTGPQTVQVEWNHDRRREWIDIHKLRCGFRLRMHVQDVPRSRVRRSLGEGVVVETRILGGREQVLVEFPWRGERLWLPWENLRQVNAVKHRFLIPQPGQTGDAEAFRLRNLAHALEMWNENTGSLSHLDIDPLPHQIHLVHHILASGNLNWLIADDVGLGKTIEVGMLLAALRQRGQFRRILLVTPAGLTRQWQDELRIKFGMDEFQIHGRDFEIHDPGHWKLHDCVIGSIDRLKMVDHRESLLQAEPWDLIVFDEAHRLSRRQWGSKLEAAERYKLAGALRHRTDSLLLLSATPHQGMQDKFQALLELLRPEWRREITALQLNPEILREMIIRNHKADVTDSEGNFIFKGKTTSAVRVPVAKDAKEFDRQLGDYIRRGYAASERLGRKGNAIGFVMTIYRKLAASSAAAIHQALGRRMERLRLEQVVHTALPSDEEPDERYLGEWEETFEASDKEFFEGEIALLEELIQAAETLLRNDLKLKAFIDELLATVLAEDGKRKVVVFTEYRATQAYIANTLERHFGPGAAELLHGSLSTDERREAISRFEDAAQFLVSTEAGGEGINLHRRCHVMVNYDLPWNPMRLVQRIGRLYRYGQQHRVIVFNIHSPQTLDGKIMDHMYTRILQVVQDMSVLGREFNEKLADDILGELADLLDVESILEEAADATEPRTLDRLEEALARARGAVEKQRELFQHVRGFDPDELRYELRITSAHVETFAAGMLTQLGAEVRKSHGELLWEVRLPESLLNDLPGTRPRWRVTPDRVWATNRRDVEALDMSSPLMRLLLQRARSYDFGGQVAALEGMEGSAVLTAILRWQNEQGRRMRQEFFAARVLDDGTVEENADAFSRWLLSPASGGTMLPEGETAKTWLKAARNAAELRLGRLSNKDLHPESRQWLSGGWLTPTSGTD